MKDNGRTLQFIKDAFALEFQTRDEGRMFYDRYPLTFIEKLVIVLDHLRSKPKMEQLVNAYSSVQYGAHLLNSVFPKHENPDEFHSRNGIVMLEEHPAQVMGWDEYKAQIDEGVKMGLDQRYIEFGFEEQAGERGIDLEWSFHAIIPDSRENSPTSPQSALHE